MKAYEYMCQGYEADQILINQINQIRLNLIY